MTIADENEIMIAYSEMAGFDFNSESYKEVKEIEETINGVWAMLMQLWFAKTAGN